MVKGESSLEASNSGLVSEVSSSNSRAENAAIAGSHLSIPLQVTQDIDLISGGERKTEVDFNKATVGNDGILNINDAEDELEDDEAHLGRLGEVDEDEVILLATIPSARIRGAGYNFSPSSLKAGDSVELRRDPLNISDRNAIEVRYARKGKKIGYVAKDFAARIAPLIDSRSITTRCIAKEVPFANGPNEKFTMSVALYGSRQLGRSSQLDFAFPSRAKNAARIAKAFREATLLEERRAEGERLKTKDRLNGAKQGNFIGNTEENRKMDPLMRESIQINRRENGDMFAHLFKEGMLDPSKLMAHPCPPGKKDKSMRTDLLKFQSQGLAWMIRMEHPILPKTVNDPPVQLWAKRVDVEGQTFWYNIVTQDSHRERPVLSRGGILADEMGLGKTMQTIALICTDDTGEGVLKKAEDPDERYDDMTLIVCPLSVTSNWTDQLHHHVGSKRLKWHLYHGEGRTLSLKQLRKFDIVVVPYQTLSSEFHDSPTSSEIEPTRKKMKLNNPEGAVLHSISWRRVVLDEGHTIKNRKAKMSIACSELKAERRWILTGTPIINSITDLGAMMTFLRLCRPLNDKLQWARYVEQEVKRDGLEGARLLRAIVSSTTLRRTKDMTDANGQLLIKLPEIKFYLHIVKLAPETRKLYDEISKVLSGIIGGWLKTGMAGGRYTQVLVFLLRLRQIACDPSLCPASFIEDVRAHRVDTPITVYDQPKLHVNETIRLQCLLREMIEEADEECAICWNIPAEPRITACSHIFCADCIMQQVEVQGNCPVCQSPLTLEQIINTDDDLPGGFSTKDQDVVPNRPKGEEGLGEPLSAAKTKQLIEFLKATESDVKSLVFSQWTTHLNLIEAALEQAGISACRFDGSMNQQARERIISTFSTPNSVKRPVNNVRGGNNNNKNDSIMKAPPTVMLISLKAGALGLNLTCASQVFLMDPWWQASIEQQAIDRVYRIGQTRPVKVFQLVAENTVEDKVLEIQKRKDKLISQAFSGHKHAVKEKRKIESKLDDIAVIFGI